jgi:hypothetical protein|uniref:Uncharacterized protein n=1 Tax=viral metagenome TaxID=1070528 RepID=A0A6C0DGV0_9ZZZZ
MTKRSYRNKKGGNADINLPYSADNQMKYGGYKHTGNKKGGAGEPYSSASSYGVYVNGPDVNNQFNRVFSQTGLDASNPSNNIVGVQGQNIPKMLRGGSKRRVMKRTTSMKHRKGKRGGYFGQVLRQAIVPFGLLGLQQTFGRRKHKSLKHKMTRRYRK